MKKIGIWLVTRLLRGNLSIQERNELLVHILDLNQAVPLHDTIYLDNDGILIVNGRSLSLEQMMQLRESAKAALDNTALSLIRQQVMYEAVGISLFKGKSDLDLYASRFAVWWGNQVEAKLKLLAQRTQEPSL